MINGIKMKLVLLVFLGFFICLEECQSISLKTRDDSDDKEALSLIQNMEDAQLKNGEKSIREKIKDDAK